MNQPGIYSGVPMEAYLADPTPGLALSSGCVHTLLTQSAAHAWAHHPKNPKRVPGDESVDMDAGSIAHSLLLEQDDSGIVVVDAADFRTKAAREARDAARADGKYPVLPHKLADIRNMRDAALEYIERSEIRGVFLSGEPESVVIAEEDGVWMRARPDWLTADRTLHVSFKTTPGSAEPEGFIRGRLMSLGHDTALAFYGRAIELACGTRPSSCLLVQETNPPYACSLISLDPAMSDFAERKVERAITTWRQCVERKHWPAYPTRICYAEPPAWMVAQEDERHYRAELDEAQEREGLQV